MNSRNTKNKKAYYIKSNFIKKFDSFIYDVIEDRELVKFTREIRPRARIAIFGGMLRDFSLYGRKEFSSDIDIVIQANSNTNLINILKKYDTEINSFGGLRVKVGRWLFDIWYLENTWAFKQGIIKEQSFQSLVNTTFFNWDAIVLELNNKNRKIYCNKNYFKDLGNRFLTINLEENPNPNGIIVRTLKRFIENDANLSFRLAKYVDEGIDDIGREIFLNDIEKFKKNSLSQNMVIMALDQIHQFINEKNKNTIAFINPQFKLSFDQIEEVNQKYNNDVNEFKENLSSKLEIKYIKEQISLAY